MSREIIVGFVMSIVRRDKIVVHIQKRGISAWGCHFDSCAERFYEMKPQSATNQLLEIPQQVRVSTKMAGTEHEALPGDSLDDNLVN